MKVAVVLLACAVTGAAFARPHGGFRGGVRHAPIVHHHHGGGWGRGGCNFWPGFVGGLIGGAVTSAIVEPIVASPTVVATPTVVTTPVVTQPVVV